MEIENKIKEVTNNSLIVWVNRMLPLAPKETKDIFEQSRLDWVVDLTNQLFIIKEIDKGVTEGRIILLNTILGSLTESWLKFFYSVYYKSYSLENTKINKKQDKKSRKKHLIPPNELSFEQLRQFSDLVFCKEINIFIKNSQINRNMIHSFNDSKIKIGNIDNFELSLVNYDSVKYFV